MVVMFTSNLIFQQIFRPLPPEKKIKLVLPIADVLFPFSHPRFHGLKWRAGINTSSCETIAKFSVRRFHTASSSSVGQK